MTRVEVTQLAQKNGDGKSDAGWLSRANANPRAKTKELALANPTFHNGRLTAVRKGEYDPNTSAWCTGRWSCAGSEASCGAGFQPALSVVLSEEFCKKKGPRSLL